MRNLLFCLLSMWPVFLAAQILYSDIPYHADSGVDPNLLSLDVYQPENTTDLLPVMVYIHGGYWNAGDKANVGQRAKLFTDSGYVFVSINYRLSPDPVDTLSPDAVRFPVHPEDCARAVRWVYDHIDEYQGDSTRISLIGHSAGAHLALLLSTNEAFLEQEGLALLQIKCTCSLDAGVFDVAEELQQAGSYIPRRAPLINAFGTDPALYDNASPQFHLDAGKYLPRMHLVHQNTNDRLHSHYRFRDSLLANGHLYVSLFNAAPYNHGQINANLGSPSDSIGETQEVMAFFEQCLQSYTTGATVVSDARLSLRLSPVPAYESITLSGLSGDFQGTVTVYDVTGRPVFTGHRSGSTFTVPVSHLVKGIYFLQLSEDRGGISTKKFLKE